VSVCPCYNHKDEYNNINRLSAQRTRGAQRVRAHECSKSYELILVKCFGDVPQETVSYQFTIWLQEFLKNSLLLRFAIPIDSQE